MSNRPDGGLAKKAATAAALASEGAAAKRRTAYRLLALFLALALLAALTLNASAQAVKYDVLPASKLSPEDHKSMVSAAKAYVGARDLSGLTTRQQQMAQYYYTRYLPAEITQPRISVESSKLLLDAQKRLLSAMKSRAPAASRVSDWLYSGLKPIAAGNYSPTARVSAILCMSRLDSSIKNGVPVPDSKVIADLLPIYRDAKAPDSVRAAALQGIDRFVRYTPSASISAAGKTAIAGAMNQLLQDAAPAGRDPMAHAYMQRFAVNILSNLTDDANLAKTLVSVSTKADVPDLIALHSAAKFGSVQPSAVKGTVPTPNDVVKNWSTRAVKVMRSEIERMGSLNKKPAMSGGSVKQPLDPKTYLNVKKPDEEKRPSATRRMGMDEGMEGMENMDAMMEDSMMGMMEQMGDGMQEMMMMQPGMMPGMMAAANPQSPEIIASLQKLNYTFEQIHAGATGSPELGTPRTPGGLLAAVDPAAKPVVEGWLAVLTDVVKAMNEDTLDTEKEYITALEENVVKLEAYADAPAAAAAVDPDAAAPAAGTNDIFNLPGF